MSLSKDELAEIKKHLLTPGNDCSDVSDLLDYDLTFPKQKKHALAMEILNSFSRSNETYKNISDLLGIPIYAMTEKYSDYHDGPASALSPDSPIKHVVEGVEIPMPEPTTEELIRGIKEKLEFAIPRQEKGLVSIVKELRSMRQETNSQMTKLNQNLEELIRLMKISVRQELDLDD